MKVFGIAGWSGAGKTTLIERLIPALIGQGLRISLLKHAHHRFDIDHPGKDSWRHRRAGASQVLVASSQRWALMTELRDAPEPGLDELLSRFDPCDLVLVEGWKFSPIPKIEVYRPALGKPPLHPDDPWVAAVASDSAVEANGLPTLALDDIAAIAAFVVDHRQETI
jgi:molybdopterin-guanine dinucleotide biosynthesis protein B